MIMFGEIAIMHSNVPYLHVSAPVIVHGWHSQAATMACFRSHIKGEKPHSGVVLPHIVKTFVPTNAAKC